MSRMSLSEAVYIAKNYKYEVTKYPYNSQWMVFLQLDRTVQPYWMSGRELVRFASYLIKQELDLRSIVAKDYPTAPASFADEIVFGNMSINREKYLKDFVA